MYRPVTPSMPFDLLKQFQRGKSANQRSSCCAVDSLLILPIPQNRLSALAKRLPRHNCSCHLLSAQQNLAAGSTCLLVWSACGVPETESQCKLQLRIII